MKQKKEVTVSEMVKEIMQDKEITNKDISIHREVSKSSNHITMNQDNPKIPTLKSLLEALGEELIIYANKKQYKIK